jgi:hypothetical protein
MAKKRKKENVFNIAFNERDEEIRRLELQRSDAEEDLEEAIAEFLKLSGKKGLKRRKSRIAKVLLDSKDPDRMK